MAYANRIPAEPRARLLPEERLEALIVSSDEQAVASLMRDEPSGLAKERRLYLYSLAIRRKRQLILELRDLYAGRCQVCGWSPRDRYAVELCEVHHLQWLSRGGLDRLSNVVLLCPNHHRAVHGADAPFDYVEAKFAFPHGDEHLSILKHGPACD